jgi:hypothetical protein
MFLDQTDKYSEFDEEGIPVKDKDGKPFNEVIF